MSARTPGPWGIIGAEPSMIALKRPHWRLGSLTTRKGVALVFGDTDANADFIVTACNAHDELVAALERIAEYCGNRGAALPSVVHMARAALAAALTKVQL